MGENIGIKVNNLENQYRILKADVQVASVELTGFYDKIEKAKGFLLDSDNKLSEQNDILAKLKIEEKDILDKIGDKNKALELKKLLLENQKTIRRQALSEITQNKKREIALLKGTRKEKSKLESDKKRLINGISKLKEYGLTLDKSIEELKRKELNLIESQNKEKENLESLEKKISSRQVSLEEIKQDFQLKMDSINRYKQRCGLIEKQLRIKERDLNILAMRLTNEFKKINRNAIPIKKIEIPKYEETN